MPKSFKDTVKSVLTEANVHPKDDTNNTPNVKTLKPSSKHKEKFGIDKKNTHGLTPEFEDLGAPHVHPNDGVESKGRAAARNILKAAKRRADSNQPGEPGYKLREELENLSDDITTIEEALAALSDEAISDLVEMEAEQVAELFGEDSVETIVGYLQENVEFEDDSTEELSEDDDGITEEQFIGVMEAIAEDQNIDINNLSEDELDELSEAAAEQIEELYGKGSLTKIRDFHKTAGDANVRSGSVEKGKFNKTYTGHRSSEAQANTLIRKGNKAKMKKVNEQDIEDIQLDMSDDVAAMFNGEDLSEEFKEKAAGIFETAVKAKIVEYQKELDEAFVESLEEATEELAEALEAKVEKYMEYVVEEWINENEVAVEQSLRNEITEDFIAGLRNLFIEHYIDVPESQIDVLEELAEEVEELKEKLDDQIKTNLDMQDELNEAKKIELFATYVNEAKLTDTQIDKLASLIEGVDYDDEDGFLDNLNTLKENYFPVNKKAPAKTLQEENLEVNEDTQELSGPMSKYVKALSRSKL